MFQRILVPLDGSPAAERAIAIAANLARPVRGTIIFLHIVTPATVLHAMHMQPVAGEMGWTASAKEVQQTEAREAIMTRAASYLATTIDRYARDLADLPVETEVTFGTTPPTFPATTHLGKVDLLVLCGHREAGLGQWGMESAVQRIVRQSPFPLLILNEHAPEMPVLDGAHSLCVLVPLDGSLFAESALTPALQLLTQHAESGKRELCLVHVENEIERHSSSQTQPEQQGQLRYLQSVADSLRRGANGKTDLHITCQVASGQDVSRAILDVQKRLAEAAPATSLIALATHGREGLARQARECVGEHLLEATTTPLLIVGPHHSSTQPAPVALPGVNWS